MAEVGVWERLRTLVAKARGTALEFVGRSNWWANYAVRTPNDFLPANEGRDNSIVAASVRWIERTYPEARLMVQKFNGKDWVEIPNHPLVRLINRPNPYYSGSLMIGATIPDFLMGDGFWIKLRNPNTTIGQLWWAPSWTMTPVSESNTTYIDYYEYNPNGTKQRFAFDDVVHFRYGLDPQNPRRGRGPLKDVLSEIYTDDEATRYTAALLRNMGIPGLIISPGKGTGGKLITIDEKEANALKADVVAKTTGNQRGQPIVMSANMEVTKLAFDPGQLNLRDVHKLPEERVTAIIGVPAIVVGMGAGLDRSTFANMAEAKESAYESCLIPLQRLSADELTVQLLPDFETDLENFRVAYDYSEVRVLQPDMDALFTRANGAWGSGLGMLDEAREIVGLPPLPKKQGQVFFIPSSGTITPADELIPPEPDPALPAAPTVQVLPSGEDGAGNGGVLPPDPSQVPEMVRQQEAARAAAGKGQKRARAINSEDVAQRMSLFRVTNRFRATKDVYEFLYSQRQRVMLRVDDSKAIKALTDRDIWNDDEENTALVKTLLPWYDAALEHAQKVAGEVFPINPDNFQLDDPETVRYLRDAGQQIRGINETTRKAIAKALQLGYADRESPSQLRKRLEVLPQFSRARAQTIARTELGHAMNTAARHVYARSGLVEKIKVYDGDYDAPCSAISGKEFPLDEAHLIPTLAHPNCKRAFGPIVSEARLEDAIGTQM